MFRYVLAAWLSLAMQAGAEEFSIETFIARAAEADIVVLGEVHDNPDHHATQAAIVAALRPDALVFEMIPQAMDEVVNDLRLGDVKRQDLARALDWDQSGWPDFDFYAPILEAAPLATVFGAGQPFEDIRKVAREGAATVFGSKALDYGLDVPLSSDEQAIREDQMAVSHCNALPPEALGAMVEVQRFRDAALADAALRARASSGPTGQVVVITGTGHADRIRGMPAMISHADENVRVISLGQGESTSDPETDLAYDAWATAPAPEREDPCAAFTHEKSE